MGPSGRYGIHGDRDGCESLSSVGPNTEYSTIAFSLIGSPMLKSFSSISDDNTKINLSLKCIFGGISKIHKSLPSKLKLFERGKKNQHVVMTYGTKHTTLSEQLY